jgi:hypothetical protein
MSFIKDGIGLPPHGGQKPEWEKQVVEKFEYFKNELWTLAANVFPKSLKAARTICFAQKWHHSGGLEGIDAWRRYDSHLVAIDSQCLHQAADVHGLGTAAHRAMVVDELQCMKPRKKTELAAATVACWVKTFNGQQRANYGTGSLMTGRAGTGFYAEWGAGV